MKKIAIVRKAAVIAAVFLVGCSPSGDLVPYGNGTFEITKQPRSPWDTKESMNTLAMRQGDAYCSTKGKSLELLISHAEAGDIFSKWEGTRIVFLCK